MNKFRVIEIKQTEIVTYGLLGIDWERAVALCYAKHIDTENPLAVWEVTTDLVYPFAPHGGKQFDTPTTMKQWLTSYRRWCYDCDVEYSVCGHSKSIREELNDLLIDLEKKEFPKDKYPILEKHDTDRKIESTKEGFYELTGRLNKEKGKPTTFILGG